MASLIWTIVAVLVILWLLGIGFHIGGTLIFLLLVLAIIGVVYN
ncbi:MAG: lmo0937 family membrane protein, partial [Chloroflexi bacterium]